MVEPLQSERLVLELPAARSGFAQRREPPHTGGVRPATAIVTIILLLVIAGAAIYQTVELLNPPESVPSQLPD